MFCLVLQSAKLLAASMIPSHALIVVVVVGRVCWVCGKFLNFLVDDWMYERVCICEKWYWSCVCVHWQAMNQFKCAVNRGPLVARSPANYSLRVIINYCEN